MGSSASRRYRPVKTPTVLQMEAAECGAAALGIILEYHGRYVPLDVLRDDCGVSRDGSNAFYIKEAAKRYGLEVKAFRKPAEGLFNRRPPFIVFWEWNHFLVVEGFRPRKGLPERSGERPPNDRLRRIRAGLQRDRVHVRAGPEVRQARQAAERAASGWRRLSTSKTALVFVILAGLALVIPNLVLAAFQRVFIDEILISGPPRLAQAVLVAMAADGRAAARRGRLSSRCI